ncbi:MULTISPECIES: dienelactone hydrolase family protein [Rheinheimera]|uniref:Dienelactone hydrolase family protein n=1 Tax=Rheinheimera marina TaxID=1774958 RepID=A0ABV9JLC5_9GAMM
MQVEQRSITLNTATGPMRVYQYQPLQAAELGRSYPAVLFYSEIFQQTAPISRTATLLASHGLVVLVPEIFHELNPQGTVLAYDDAGKDKGNQDKWTKPLEHYDSDNQAMLTYLKTLPYVRPEVGAFGVCIGGHLAFRAALQSEIKAAYCLYATDLHSDTLPTLTGKQTLALSPQIQAELVMVWGKQDPHVPAAGRAEIYRQLTSANARFSWFEYNAEHAFMRDEGNRYDAALALENYQRAITLFKSM